MENSLEKIAAEISTTLIKDFCAKALSSVSDPIAKNLNKITTDFNQHLTKNYIRNKFVRVLCNKAEPIALDKIYVSGEFSCGEKVVDSQGLMQIIRDNQKVIIKGDGGLGKTLFVKKLWSALFDEPEGRIPIFIPLRELNEQTDLNLREFIRLTVLPNTKHSESTFEYFCNQGTFVFLFDGFDEVIESQREKLKPQLIELTRSYSNCGYLISSRVTGKFNAWEDFSEYTVNRATKEQIIDVLKKVPYAGNKSKFIKKITSSYYEENKSFLSNPLLAIMMMITFNDNPQSSGKKSTFYENAYQTLYSLHDGLKGAYERERSLDKDTFRSIFSHFCLFTYYNEEVSFNDNDYRAAIKNTLSFLGIEANIDEVIKEFCESTNLMQIEGLQYSFIHRSFQEYFAASCATKDLTDRVKDFLQEFHKRGYDDTFVLAYEIHPSLVEKEFFLPELEKLKNVDALPRSVSDANYPFHFFSALNLSVLIYKLEGVSTVNININEKVGLSLTNIDDLLFVDRVHHTLDLEETNSFGLKWRELKIKFEKTFSDTNILEEIATPSNNKKKKRPRTRRINLIKINFRRHEMNYELCEPSRYQPSNDFKKIMEFLNEETKFLNIALKKRCYRVRDLNSELSKKHKNSKKSLEDILKGVS